MKLKTWCILQKVLIHFVSFAILQIHHQQHGDDTILSNGFCTFYKTTKIKPWVPSVKKGRLFLQKGAVSAISILRLLLKIEKPKLQRKTTIISSQLYVTQ